MASVGAVGAAGAALVAAGVGDAGQCLAARCSRCRVAADQVHVQRHRGRARLGALREHGVGTAQGHVIRRAVGHEVVVRVDLSFVGLEAQALLGQSLQRGVGVRRRRWRRGGGARRRWRR